MPVVNLSVDNGGSFKEDQGMSIRTKHFRLLKSIFATLMFAMITSVSFRTALATEPTNVIFIHGANVGEQDARVWASEMFKRLWHSGAQMEFHPIAWEAAYDPFDDCADVDVVLRVVDERGEPVADANTVVAYQISPEKGEMAFGCHAFP